MRRLAILRQASGLLRPHRPAPCASQWCLSAAQGTGNPSFSTTRPRPARRDAADAAPLDAPPAQDAASATSAEPAAETAVVEPERPATRLARRPSRPAEPIATDMVLPPEPQWAPSPKDVTYTPAVTGDGLEMVGGLDGWWDREGHWSGRLGFAPFFAGGAARVTDAAALEVIVRRAAVEALAVRAAAAGPAKEGHGEAEVTLTGRWAVGGREAVVRALGVSLEVASDGKARLATESAAHLVADLAADAEDAGPDALDAGEAAALVETWDPSWKTMSLDDVALKFAIAKRVQQLSGHILVDSKLNGVRTVNDLVKVLVTPPRPKKLAEEIESRGELAKLPNVTVYNRRVTPIDKDKMVGRWKVVAQELEKRDLPVTGKGKHGRSVEKSWVRGGA
ncbi:hypothetical protein RB595_000432 [Gaeumannomyces hyphopodioides]